MPSVVFSKLRAENSVSHLAPDMKSAGQTLRDRTMDHMLRGPFQSANKEMVVVGPKIQHGAELHGGGIAQSLGTLGAKIEHGAELHGGGIAQSLGTLGAKIEHGAAHHSEGVGHRIREAGAKIQHGAEITGVGAAPMPKDIAGRVESAIKHGVEQLRSSRHDIPKGIEDRVESAMKHGPEHHVGKLMSAREFAEAMRADKPKV